jgi:N-acetylglucosaminyldiphosphoundecaprenol N-acetyl-beta-D-mannosaminyltransferase
VAEKAAAVLQAQVPTLRVVGTHHGYFEKSPGHPDNDAVVQAINAARPDMLIVAFGMPTQEQWLHENWARLEAGAALTVGAAFDYLAGEVQRGPRWMTDHGLEWLSRLVVEPRRLWRRYLLGNPLFLWRVVRQRLGL